MTTPSQEAMADHEPAQELTDDRRQLGPDGQLAHGPGDQEQQG
jgi:hypothetical protein